MKPLTKQALELSTYLHRALAHTYFNPWYVDIHCIDGERYPLVVLDSKDRGRIPTLALDLSAPSLRNECVQYLGDNRHMSLRIESRGLPERLIELPPTFQEVKSRWKRFYRYFDVIDNYELVDELPNDSELRPVVQFNMIRWEERLERPRQPASELLMCTWYKWLQENQVHKFFHFRHRLRQEVHAVVEYVLEDRTLHWVNTYMGADVPHLGNACLLTLIKKCVMREVNAANGERVTRLNMGVDFFEYKKLWTDVVEYAPGLAYKEEQE